MFKKILIANRGANAQSLRRSQIALRAQHAKGD